MQRNKLIWILIPVVVIIAGGYAAWSKNLIPGLKNQSDTQNKNQNSATPLKYENRTPTDSGFSAPSDSSNISASENAAQETDEDSPEEKRSSEKTDENFRQQIIAYVNQNINKLVTPPANDKWDVPTFYFVGNTNFYLELYALDADLAGYKLLYKASKDGNKISLNELARYKETEDDWVLSQGQDNFDNYVMEEYDYNEDNKKWEKTDEFTDETYADNLSDTDSESDSAGSTPAIVR